MATATKKQTDTCEDHQTPICAECGYCTEDPEHAKHSRARTRYHMDNGVVMIEHTERAALEQIRSTDARFKRRRIQNVIQAYPSQVAIGVVYEMNTYPPKVIN